MKKGVKIGLSLLIIIIVLFYGVVMLERKANGTFFSYLLGRYIVVNIQLDNDHDKQLLEFAESVDCDWTKCIMKSDIDEAINSVKEHNSWSVVFDDNKLFKYLTYRVRTKDVWPMLPDDAEAKDQAKDEWGFGNKNVISLHSIGNREMDRAFRYDMNGGKISHQECLERSGKDYKVIFQSLGIDNKISAHLYGESVDRYVLFEGQHAICQIIVERSWGT